MSKQDRVNGAVPLVSVRKDGDSQSTTAAVDARRLTVPEDPEKRAKGDGKGRRTKLAAFGLSPSMIRRGDPDYAVCLNQANKYRKSRMKELAAVHGHVSAGAGALLSSASLALAASRFLYQRAAADGDSAQLKQAAQLADSARQAELAAWELCAREGILRRRAEAASAGMPWLLNADGSDPKKTGRKTNAQRQERQALEAPVPAVVELEPEVTDG
jgi:hypothetical protein